MLRTVLETPRLRLRGVCPEDFDALFQFIFQDELVMQHLSGSTVARERALQVFREVFDHEGTGRKPGIVEDRHTNQVLGYAGLLACSALGEDDFELGFVLRREAWGRGYATEIGLAQLDYGFRTTSRSRLLAQVRPANNASRHVLSKLRMSFVKEYERPERGLWQVFCHDREA